MTLELGASKITILGGTREVIVSLEGVDIKDIIESVGWQVLLDSIDSVKIRNYFGIKEVKK